MTPDEPLELLLRTAALLDELSIPYVGGSFAATFFGEPRSTMDIDVAVVVDRAAGDDLIERVRHEFYVPEQAARRSILDHGSFNLLSLRGGMKVDLFVLGEGLLDRRQIERRVRIPLPGAPDGLWVTSPDDQVLRKLQWYRDGGEVSDRQWRDVLGLLRGSGDAMDVQDLRSAAAELGLSELLDAALAAAA